MNGLKLIGLILNQVESELHNVCGIIRESEEIETESNLRLVADVIFDLYLFEEAICKIDPSIKRVTQREKEIEADPNRFHELAKIYNKAYLFEKDKQFSDAKTSFEKLLSLSHYGCFKQVAEAGLYRAEKAISTSKQIAQNEIKAH